MKKVIVEIKDKNTLILLENAQKGDYIDLQDINSVDLSTLEKVILNAKDEIYQERLQNAIKVEQAQFELNQQQQSQNLKLEIERLKEKLQNSQQIYEQEKLLAISKAIQDKDNEINSLNMKLQTNEIQSQLQLQNELNKKNQEIQNLQNEILNEQNNAKNIANDFQTQIQMHKQEIEHYKNFKLKLSTKMLGESLEIHCQEIYEMHLRAFLPNAIFQKDNEVINGSKGDFIFKDFIGADEYISIMFEMKNEADDSQHKHKNEDFFEKLNRDRNNKKCEYAILVSMLESDSQLYNKGIVDVSHKFEKMFVIRPEFFEITLQLLCSQAKKIYESKKELIEFQKKEIDITNFENELMDFKDKFGRNYRLASEKFQKAIEQIDKTIASLNKIKSDLLSSEDNYRLANKKLEQLNLKKLTKNSPSLQQQN